MSVYVADRGSVHIECDMAYTKYLSEDGHYIPCEIRGPVSLECIAKAFGAPARKCAETEFVKICRRDDGEIEAIIYFDKCVARGLTPGELAKRLLTVAELCAQGVIS